MGKEQLAWAISALRGVPVVAQLGDRFKMAWQND